MKKKRFRLGDILRKMDSGEHSDAGPHNSGENAGGQALKKNKADEPAEEIRGRFDNIPPQPDYTSGIKTESPQKTSDSKNAENYITHDTAAGEYFPEISAKSGNEKTKESFGFMTDLAKQETGQGDSVDEYDNFDILQYLSVIIRRKEIVILSLIIAIIFSLFSYLRASRYYVADALLLFKPNSEVEIGFRSSWMNHYNREDELNTHLELIRSGVILEKVENELGGAILSRRIGAGLSISRSRIDDQENNVIRVSIRHPDAEIARDAVNQLCKTYIEYSRQVETQEETRFIVKLNTQIDKLSKELDEKEEKLKNFKEKNTIVQISNDANLVIAKLSRIELALQETELNLLENRERLNSIKTKVGEQEVNIVSSMTYNNPYQSKISDMEVELSTLSAEYSSDHYKVKKLSEQIEKLKEAMLNDVKKRVANSQTFVKNPVRESLLQQLVSISTEISALEKKRNAQQDIRNRLEMEMQKLPELEKEYISLQRKTESLVSTLKMIRMKYEEAKIRRDSKESDLKIFELAELPENSIPSKKPTSVLFGIMVGLIIGIGLAFLIDYLDQTFKDPSDAERSLMLPLLGIIPVMEIENQVINTEEKSKKSKIEPFRALRANIKHLAAANSSKMFMINSAVKEEGKTMLAVNTAIIFAMDGKKVILVDADLRRSQIHLYFDIDKEVGLYDYLIGRKEIDEIMKPTFQKNLSIITSGERSNNPSELLGGPVFKAFMKKLRSMADIIIIDSPAFLPVSDAMAIAPEVDGVIVVARALWTPRKAAKQTLNQLKRINSNMMGIIFNRVSHSKGYYPYYYGYYGYYSYKYAYDYYYEEELQKPFSFRELGLRVEKGIKKFFKEFFFSIPKYISLGCSTLKNLLSRKTTWFLIFLLVVVTIIRYTFFYGDKINIEEEEFVFLEERNRNNVNAANSGVTADEAESYKKDDKLLENIKDKKTFSLSSDTGVLTVADLSGENKNGAFDYKKNLKAWVGERVAGKFVSSGDYYDTASFKFPGGGFAEFKKELMQEDEDRTVSDSVTEIEFMSGEKIKTNYYKTTIRVRTSVRGGRSKIEWDLLWKKFDRGWRIVGERKRYADKSI